MVMMLFISFLCIIAALYLGYKEGRVVGGAEAIAVFRQEATEKGHGQFNDKTGEWEWK